MAFTAKEKLSPEAKLFFSHGIASQEILDLIMNVMVMDNSPSDLSLDELKKVLHKIMVYKRYDEKEIIHWCRHALKDIEAGDELASKFNKGYEILKMAYGEEWVDAISFYEFEKDLMKPISERTRLYLIHACAQVEAADEVIKVIHIYADFISQVIEFLDHGGSAINLGTTDADDSIEKVEELDSTNRDNDDEEIPEYPEHP